MKKTTAIVLAALLAFAAASYAADVLYVQSVKATIKDAPSFKAKTVATVSKGVELTVVEKKEKWYKVSFRDMTGWVPSMVVGAKPPLNRVSVFTGKETNIGTDARRRASQVTSAAAARGLTEDDRMRAGQKDVADYELLDKVESNSVTEGEVSDFQKEAK